MELYLINTPPGIQTTEGAENTRMSRESFLLPISSPWLEPAETFEEYTRYFGMNVQRLRREAKMSRMFLASISGVSVSTLTRLERGGTDPRLSSMCSLSQALDIPLWDLLSAPPRVDLKVSTARLKNEKGA